MGLSMCLPGSATTLKDGIVQQSNFSDFTVARITDMPEFAVHIVPSIEPPTGMEEPSLPPLAPAFANAIAHLPASQSPAAIRPGLTSLPIPGTGRRGRRTPSSDAPFRWLCHRQVLQSKLVRKNPPQLPICGMRTSGS
jgi:hypothetical protein